MDIKISCANNSFRLTLIREPFNAINRKLDFNANRVERNVRIHRAIYIPIFSHSLMFSAHVCCECLHCGSHKTPKQFHIWINQTGRHNSGVLYVCVTKRAKTKHCLLNQFRDSHKPVLCSIILSFGMQEAKWNWPLESTYLRQCDSCA